MLSISLPNTDRSLLTMSELRAAAGVTGGSKDAALLALGNYVAAMITKICRVASDGVTPPTLRLETVTETYRLAAGQSLLILSRRPVVSIGSITENAALLDSSLDYLLESGAGLLHRLCGDVATFWPYGTSIVTYSAGYATVPADLKYAAIKFVQAELTQGDRDPMLKSKSTEGVSSYEWWVDPTKDSIVPAEVMDILNRGGYVNHFLV